MKTPQKNRQALARYPLKIIHEYHGEDVVCHDNTLIYFAGMQSPTFREYCSRASRAKIPHIVTYGSVCGISKDAPTLPVFSLWAKNWGICPPPIKEKYVSIKNEFYNKHIWPKVKEKDPKFAQWWEKTMDTLAFLDLAFD